MRVFGLFFCGILGIVSIAMLGEMLTPGDMMWAKGLGFLIVIPIALLAFSAFCIWRCVKD